MFAGVERVRLVVGERAVELEVQGKDLERQAGEAGRLAEHRWHREAAHPVAGIHDHTQRAGCSDRSTSVPQVRGVVGEHVQLALLSRVSPRPASIPSAEVLRSARSRMAFSPVSALMPAGARAAELDAVVGRRDCGWP
jgi:hypothetical protein